jgi:hypothetical protein
MNMSEFENIYREISNAFQGVLSWKWDNRFEAVLGEFNVNNIDSVREVLERYLSNVLDSSNIDKAPDAVNRAINNFGGLMQGQMFFTSDINRDTFIFCAWWPWGNGATISIRIAPYCNKPDDPENVESIKLLKSCFGI